MRLLLAEADPSVAEDLTSDLRRHGFVVHHVCTAAEALTSTGGVDLMLLGLELPDLDGLEVCRLLRERCDLPIIGMTCRDSEMDRVLGLQAGLDDYVTKPVPPQELLARIDAVMRRVRAARGAVEEPAHRELIAHGSLLISLRTREVRVRDRRVSLTRKEFDLLALLASEPGRVFSRRRIMAKVWNDDSSVPSRTIDTHVGALRAKLGARTWVRTVHGVGFCLGSA